MDFLCFCAAVMALWRLGRINYWQAYPLFYLKLVLATVCYFNPHPYSDSWWYGIWSTLEPIITALMVMSAIEAFGKFCGRLHHVEYLRLMLGCWVVGLAAFTAALFLLPPKTLAAFDCYLWIARSVHVGTAAAMTVPLVYDLLAPLNAPAVARLHFALLGIVTTAVALGEIAYPFITGAWQWQAVHYGFSTVYAAMLMSWVIVTPKAICCEASVAGPSSR